MNRYPLWKNILIAAVLLIGLVYTMPNFFGESPEVQVSPVRSGGQADPALLGKVEKQLQDAKIAYTGALFENGTVRVRFSDTDAQFKAKDSLDRALNPDDKNPGYVAALSLTSNSPAWLTAVGALPMYLGLDLRGGVHFLMQVNMQAALTKKIEGYAGDAKSLMRDKKIYYTGIARDNMRVVARFKEEPTRAAAREVLTSNFRDLNWRDEGSGEDLQLVGTLAAEAMKDAQKKALEQNILALRNRINETGAKEPIIQQQGEDRIIVQIPGAQDPTKIKELIGRTAALEIHLVDEQADATAAVNGTVPFGDQLVYERNGFPVLVKKPVELTGDVITDAGAGFDQQTSRPSVNVSMDSKGARKIREVSRENLKKRMAILLIEKNKAPQAISVATIQDELGARFQITGLPSPVEANDLALLLRAGALAAPMDIIEERTIGPSLGKENIAKGFHSTWLGFAAISIFMIAYYVMFGFISIVALATNLLFLIGLLSLMQATLTLPGMAGIALTLGMAIDANVLINERIREELRNGNSPQAAIHAGYDRAFDTILDSNVTTFIAGIALFAFGSGPVKGFAVVLCLGILTSMFSAVVVSRALVNLIYGRRRKVEKLSIGNVSWK